MGLIEDVLKEIEDKPIDDVRIGSAFVGVMVLSRIGVAHRVDEGYKNIKNYENLKGKKVAKLIYSNDLIELAIATAAINAQLKPNNVKKGNIFKKILEIADKFDTIGIVGKFPIITQLEDLDCKFYAFEKKPFPGFLPVEKEKELLPKCDLIIITGTSFVNKTLEDLLGLCNGYTMLVGPTTPVTDVLFDYGIDVLAGVSSNSAKLLDIIEKGGGTKEFKKFVETIYIQKK